MARYTQNYVVTTNPSHVRDVVADILSTCSLVVSYITDDYVMAQEQSGKINFSKLVTVEVLIHQPSLESNSIKLTCVTKNGELPLRLGNHCQLMSELVDKAFCTSQAWQLLESSPTPTLN
ncbi:hypothetical protein Syn7502_01948 [Synechococcus sp. PCC 7502]|uniref:hypothetical protein n=1 Tax=Synechococcus sp. PCC 7502 TaxID=1173263 RepID=UPI00029FD85D|nr:hypothetical protein [Synechococcus sp. PCC 7502]AFY73979.1 hypothetical protein Syn7502_01948 [Synechococcus sp. PCC 7502]